MGADFDVSIFEKKEQPRSTFEKPEYLTLSVGQHTTRVLATPHKVFIHYIPDRKLTIACPGEDCPICKTNKRLMVEFPHDYNKQKGFMSRQTRFLMNVLDRTQVKVCPGCGAEVKRGADGKFSPMCYKCNVMVAEVPVTKSNKVKILGISQSNADVLFALHNSTLDDNNDIIGLNNFDVNWLVTKSANGKTAITPMASTNRDILDGEYKLWDLETLEGSLLF